MLSSCAVFILVTLLLLLLLDSLQVSVTILSASAGVKSCSLSGDILFCRSLLQFCKQQTKCDVDRP